MLVVKNLPVNARDMRLRFNPWMEKIPWKKTQQPTLVFLPGESLWTEEPDRLQSSQSVNSVTQSYLTLCDPMNCSTPGLSIHHYLPEFIQTHVHRVGDAIQPSHPLFSPSPPSPNSSHNQSFPMSQLFAWGGQSTGVSALASFLPKNTQDRSPLEWTGWISRDPS